MDQLKQKPKPIFKLSERFEESKRYALSEYLHTALDNINKRNTADISDFKQS